MTGFMSPFADGKRINSPDYEARRVSKSEHEKWISTPLVPAAPAILAGGQCLQQLRHAADMRLWWTG